jgi:integrase/recombinase XerD
MPGPKPQLHLPFADWPVADRDLWQRAFMGDDPFDGGVGARLAQTSKQRYLVGWRRFLGYLALEDPSALEAMPADRLTHKRVHAFVQHLRLTNGVRSVAIQLEAMYHAARLMMPERDWAWLKAIKTRLHSVVPTSSPNGPVITSVALLELGLALMDESQPDAERSLRMCDAIRYRDGLIIALLAFAPLRRRNLMALEIGRTFVEEGDGWTLLIPREKTKARREPLEFSVPEILKGYFASYLDHVRPRILGRGRSAALWVSPKRGALSYSALWGILARHTCRRWGIRIAPHDVRDAGAITWAIAAPDQIGVARDLLGHANLRTTRHYNRARGIEASRFLRKTVANLRSVSKLR